MFDGKNPRIMEKKNESGNFLKSFVQAVNLQMQIPVVCW